MGYKFNPFTGNFDATDSPNGEFESLDVSGDINLDDGGTYETTVQVVTPTANRTISFPDATGTVALVAGSSGQVTYNNAGAQAGLTSANIGSTGEINISLAGAASTPPVSFTGSWFTGGTATTTKPQLLIEPTGTTSTAWSTDGTGLGVNAASGFGGNLLDMQVNGSRKFAIESTGRFGSSNVQIGVQATYLEFIYSNTVRGIAGADDGAAMFKLPDSGFFGWAPSATVTATADIELRRDSAGVVKITSGSTGTGYIKQVPVLTANLPNAATVGAGTRGFVSDATSTTFAAAPVGGGANTVPVYSDGSNWLIG